MKKLFYPALFHHAEEGGYWIEFPDFPECLTQGEDMEEAYEMAAEALGLCITDLEREKSPLPQASSPAAIGHGDDSVLLVVGFDLAEYRRRHSSRAVKKTLSIPEWLNEEATAMGVNFSQVLQEALLQKIASRQL